MTENVVDDPVLGQRYVFGPATTVAGAPALEVELWVDPGGGVPVHRHPTFTERFEVLSGRVRIRSGSTRTVAGPGDVVEVPPGCAHSYRNVGSEEAHMRALATPPVDDLRRFLEDAAALGRCGGYTSRALPRSLRGLLGLAVIARRYRDSTVILMPPVWVQRIVLDPFATIGERRGLRKGHFAEHLEGAA